MRLRRSHVGAFLCSASLIALGASPAAGLAAVSVATYSVADVQRTSTLTVNGTDAFGYARTARIATKYRFKGPRGKNLVSIDFRNARKRTFVADRVFSKTAAGKFTATLSANMSVLHVRAVGQAPTTCVLKGKAPKSERDLQLDVEGPASEAKRRVKFGFLGPDALDLSITRTYSEIAPAQTGCAASVFAFAGPKVPGYTGRTGEKPGWRSIEVPQGKLRKQFNGRARKVVIRSVKRALVFNPFDTNERIGVQTTRTKMTLWLVSNKPKPGLSRSGVVIRTR